MQSSASPKLMGSDARRILAEVKTAKTKLLAARKSAIEEAVHDGLISQNSALKIIESADQEIDTLAETRPSQKAAKEKQVLEYKCTGVADEDLLRFPKERSRRSF